MDNTKLKHAVSRIMSDLVKLDSLITADELAFLDDIDTEYGVTSQERRMGFRMTLSEAVDIVSSQPEKFRRAFYDHMLEGSKADGQCSRPEALLLMAFSCAAGLNACGKGRIYSFEAKGIPLHRDQLIYVSREDRNDRTVLASEELYEDVNNIAKISGFELVYVPMIARHFGTYDSTEILKKVLRLVRPTLEGTEEELIRQLRGMTPYRFLSTILERRMKLSFRVESPCWMFKLGNSLVDGVEYANFFLLEIDEYRMKRQLKDFMAEFLQMQPEHMVMVSSPEMDADNFRYGGFIKSILDLISLGSEERWDVVIRLRECKSFIDGDGRKQKASVSIRRGEEEWPLIGPDRDAAFYALVLCSTAEDPNGVRLIRDLPEKGEVQKRYELIYGMMSVRDAERCPLVCYSETRRPIISRVNLAVNPEQKKSRSHLLAGTNYLTERELYEVAKSQNNFYVPLNPSNVFIRSMSNNRETESPLKESTLFKLVTKIKDSE